METLTNLRFGEERALYNRKNLKLIDCRFDGEEDGESALKQCQNVTADNCYFNLRYPVWHTRGVTLLNCEATENCRAALWYCSAVKIKSSTLNGIKAVRECNGVNIVNSGIVSPEFGWRSKNITVCGGEISSQYAFWECENIALDGVAFSGKYSFQYVKNAVIKNSRLNTKDAFWHAQNVTVENCEVIGEYLGWYSKNLTFINCRISGTQPLCCCKGLKLINCTMEGCDLAFEYSAVKADIKGAVQSVKNVKSGHVAADKIGEIIVTDDAVYSVKAKITAREK